MCFSYFEPSKWDLPSMSFEMIGRGNSFHGVVIAKFKDGIIRKDVLISETEFYNTKDKVALVGTRIAAAVNEIARQYELNTTIKYPGQDCYSWERQNEVGS